MVEREEGDKEEEGGRVDEGAPSLRLERDGEVKEEVKQEAGGGNAGGLSSKQGQETGTAGRASSKPGEGEGTAGAVAMYPPDVVLCNAALSACKAGGLWWEAEKIFDHMELSG